MLGSPRESPAPARRPLTLADITILVAGAAIGFAATSVQLDHPGPSGPLALAGFVLLGLGSGLVVVGPLVAWRGYRLCGRVPDTPGHWMWLVSWPTALLFVVVLATGGRQEHLYTSLVVAIAVVAVGVMVAALSTRGARASPEADQSEPTDARSLRARRSVRGMCVWAGGNVMLWLLLCVQFLARPSWEFCCLIAVNMVMWVAVLGASPRLLRSPRCQSSVWLDRIGLGATTFVPGGLLLIFFGH